MSNSQYVYVVEDERGHKYGVTETAMFSVVRYIQQVNETSLKLGGPGYRVTSIVWTELTEDLQLQMNVLDESSLKYKISAKDPKTGERMDLVVDTELAFSAWRDLHAYGYRDITNNLCCPIIDGIRNVETWQIVIAGNDLDLNKKVDQISDLLDRLENLDPNLDPATTIIRSINTPYSIDKDTADQLCDTLQKIVSQYEPEEAVIE